MKWKIFLFCIFFLSEWTFSKASDRYFARFFTGPTRVDYAISMNDGGSLMIGTGPGTTNFVSDLYVARMSPAGVVLWGKAFDLGGELDNSFTAIATSDGGVIIAAGEGQPWEMYTYLLKIDGNGGILWNKKFNLFSLGSPWSAAATSDGGVVLVGETEFQMPDAYAIKIDHSGKVVWAKSFGEENDDRFNHVEVDREGNIVASGILNAFFGTGKPTAFICKIDPSGHLVWAQSMVVSESTYNEANAVTALQEGGYLYSGYYMNYWSEDTDGFFVKLNSRGKVVWKKTFASTSDDVIESSANTRDGFVIGGRTNIDPWDGFIAKFDFAGRLLWQRLITSYGQTTMQNITVHTISPFATGALVSGYAYIASVSENGAFPNCSAIRKSSLSIKPLSATFSVPQLTIQSLPIRTISSTVKVRNINVHSSLICQ